jgi:hypothetical protein
MSNPEKLTILFLAYVLAVCVTVLAIGFRH